MNFKSENNPLRRTHLTGNGSGPSPVSQRLYPHENKLPNKAKIISKTYTQANARIRIASSEVSPSSFIQTVAFGDGYQNSSTSDLESNSTLEGDIVGIDDVVLDQEFVTLVNSSVVGSILSAVSLIFLFSNQNVRLGIFFLFRS